MSYLDTFRRSALRRSLGLVTTSGCCFMVYYCVTTCPATVKYFAALGAGEMFFGLYSGVPLLLMFMQYVGAVLCNRIRHRKPLFIAITVTGRLLYIPIMFLPLCFPSVDTGVKFAAVVVVLAVSNALMNAAGTIWLSWMADLVPQRVFNAYWGVRQRLLQFTLTVSCLVVAGFTYWSGLPITVSFPVLAAVGILAGAVDVIHFFWVEEPPNVTIRQKSILATILHPVTDREFRSFLTFSCVWSFSVMFSLAFMQLYVVKVIGISEGVATLIWAACISNALMAPFWGRMADKHGHRPVLTICAALKPVLVVVFLLVSRDTVYWLLPLALFFDNVWEAGIAVSYTGYLLQRAPKENRSMFIAAITGIAGLSGGLGAIAGGAFLKGFEGWSVKLCGADWNNYHLLFAVNIIMRLYCVLLVRKIHEPDSAGTEMVVNDLRAAWPVRLLLLPVDIYRKLNISKK